MWLWGFAQSATRALVSSDSKAWPTIMVSVHPKLEHFRSEICAGHSSSFTATLASHDFMYLASRWNEHVWLSKL